MALIKVKSLKDLNSYILDELNPSVVFIYSDMVASCNAYIPTFEKVSEKFKGYAYFIMADVEIRQIEEWARVNSVPRISFWQFANEVYNIVGAPTEEELCEKIKQVLKF